MFTMHIHNAADEQDDYDGGSSGGGDGDGDGADHVGGGCLFYLKHCIWG